MPFSDGTVLLGRYAPLPSSARSRCTNMAILAFTNQGCNGADFLHPEVFEGSESEFRAHKHLWIGGRLTVWASDFWRSTELPQLASLVNTSHDLHLYVPGALDMLSNLFLGSVKHIEIFDACFPDTVFYAISDANRLVDSIFNYKKELPVDAITNFLFNNACRNDQCRRRHLKISTRYTPEYCQEVVDSIKQKFLDTLDPSAFYFSMSAPSDWHQNNWILDHTDSEKKLHYSCFSFGSGYMNLHLDCYEYSVSTSNSTSSSSESSDSEYSTSSEYSISE
ncbi:hypothetical protein Ddc_16826 [Ditylenchus destructor]|nr:hypothetical protein Ddc_16826 [Ditylenchus destructor]